jgi:hypothetical protein
LLILNSPCRGSKPSDIPANCVLSISGRGAATVSESSVVCVCFAVGQRQVAASEGYGGSLLFEPRQVDAVSERSRSCGSYRAPEHHVHGRSAVRTRVTMGTWEGVQDGLEGSVCGGENSRKPGTLMQNSEGHSMVQLLRVNPNFNDTLLKIGSGDIATVAYASGKKALN